MEDPKSSGYQTKDNPLQRAYKALRRLEEKPEATTAEVLTQTKLIAETVRQGAIIEHERIMQIDDREQLLLIAGHCASTVIAFNEHMDAVHRTAITSVGLTVIAFLTTVLTLAYFL